MKGVEILLGIVEIKVYNGYNAVNERHGFGQTVTFLTDDEEYKWSFGEQHDDILSLVNEVTGKNCFFRNINQKGNTCLGHHGYSTSECITAEVYY